MNEYEWTSEMNGGRNMSLFIPLFKDKCDYEIIAIIISWLSNGWTQESYMQNDLLLHVMKPSPTEYVLNYDKDGMESLYNHSFLKTLTYGNYCNLIERIKHIIIAYGNVEKAYIKNHIKKRKNKCKYAHDTLALMLGGNTGFQTRATNCTFYRYNLLVYLLAYKYHIWSIDTSDALLPCNDITFGNAYKKGLIKKKMKSNLDNTIILTEMARKKYGNDFYKILNELL